jgi:Nucleotidyl transferase AbiEii toxin, Type IV TA system
VCGEIVHLQGGAEGEIESLVRAAGLVVEHASVPAAIIGGLAVTCRLATAHRATADVDVVVGDPEVLAKGGSAVDNLIDAGIARHDAADPPNRVYIGGTKVEIIETGTVEVAETGRIEPDRARLFVLAHRWALDTATPCTITVVDSDLQVDVSVATAPALIAMKLHAIQDRHEDRKRASDAWDLYRLLDANLWTSSFQEAFTTTPGDLLELIDESLERVFRSEVTRTRRWLRAYGDPSWVAQASEEALVQLAGDFNEVFH